MQASSPVIVFAAVAAAVLGCLSPTAAQAEDAAAGKDAAKDIAVALRYVTAKDPQSLPLRTVGFYLGLERRFKLQQTADSTCEAELTYSGQTFRIRVEECHSKKPELRLDLTCNTPWEDVDRLPPEGFLHRTNSYLQALLPPLSDKLAGRVLRMICVTHEGRDPYGFLEDRGAWSGTLTAGDKKLQLFVYDQNADGDLSNDKLLLDVDGDGRVTRVEQVTSGETILVGQHAITLRVRQQAPGAVAARVTGRKQAEGRDILAELKQAPVVGNVIPEFEFTDQRGKLVSSRALRGKVLLVNFWGVW
ncbi:MAG: TlpA family protein disulfide reductase [Planctomycetota bacterium]|jgi:hypothetical protein